MRQLYWTVAIAVALAGCKKEKSGDSTGEGPPERDGAAMWKLAPDGVQAGVVVAPGAGVELHRGFVEVVSSMRQNPVGSKALAEMLLGAAQLGFDPMKPDGLSAIGIDPSKGAAIFAVSEEDGYMILPVSDRAAFRKVTGGSEENGVDKIGKKLYCAPSNDLYRCATSAEKLAAWKPASQAPDAGWPTELRGSVEFFVAGSLLAEAEPVPEAMEQATLLRGGIRIERGGMLARFSVSGKAKPFLGVGQTPLADAAMKRKPAALLVGYARALIDLARADMGSKLNAPGPGGVTPATVLDALTGEIVAYGPAGQPSRGYVEIGITNKEPFKALSALCALAPPMPGVSVKQTNDGCSATIGPPTLPVTTEASFAVGDKSILVSIGDQSAGRDGSQAVLPGYVSKHKWLGALWMRGSILGGADQIPAPQLQQMLAQAPEAALGLWAFAHISELGFGFRTDDSGAHGFFRVSTTWRNPPAVVAELEPILHQLSRGDMTAVGAAKELAKKHGGSPLATDMKLGTSGGAVGAAAIGMMAAVAIPAFLKYTKKAKNTEAREFVRKMYEGARAYYMDQSVGGGLTPTEAHYPKKSTAITPPLGTCCQQGGKCLPDAKLWTDETWVQLQFSVDDPHYYSYQYEVAPDGKHFTVRAYGDLDCDGVYSTFEMYGDEKASANAGLYRENEME